VGWDGSEAPTSKNAGMRCSGTFHHSVVRISAVATRLSPGQGNLAQRVQRVGEMLTFA